MKQVILAAVLLGFTATGWAVEFGASLFASYTDEEYCCKDESAIGGNLDMYWDNGLGLEFMLQNYNPGAAVKYRHKGFSFGAGMWQNELAQFVNVNGVQVWTRDEKYNPIYFAQYEYKNVFFRYTYMDQDITLTGIRQEVTDPGPPPVITTYQNAQTFDGADHWFWLGYRFDL